MNTSNIEKNQKFRKQVSHLQSFIGMPMSSGPNPSPSEIRENDRRLLEKQALGFEPARETLVTRLLVGLMNATLTAFKQIRTSWAKCAKTQLIRAQ